MAQQPPTMTHVYVNMGYYEWLAFKKDGTRAPDDELQNEYVDARIWPWLQAQLQKRLSVDHADPVYAWPTKPPHPLSPAKRALLKVRIPSHLVLPFDDEDYVGMLNGWGNGRPEFCADSEAVEFLRKDAPEEERIASHELMFDPWRPTRTAWRGTVPHIRVFLPWLTPAMVVKVWVFRNGKRLRSRRHARR